MLPTVPNTRSGSTVILSELWSEGALRAIDDGIPLRRIALDPLTVDGLEIAEV
jgi:hypothetical protein